MTLDSIVLAGLMHACAPRVGLHTMRAIVHVESGADPNAIYDNTTGRAYLGLDRLSAATFARTLLARGDVLDLGLAQIDSVNLSRVGYSSDQLFEPCANLRAGSRILADAYRSASARFGDGQYALQRAIGAYNTGSIYGGNSYVTKVLAAANVETDIDVPDLIVTRQPARPKIVLRMVPPPRKKVVRKIEAVMPYTPFNAPLSVGPQDGRFVENGSIIQPLESLPSPTGTSIRK